MQQVVATAIGGQNITQTIEGLERYPVNLRYPQDYRDSPERLAELPIVTANGQRIALADVADIYVEDGPPAIKSENARPNGWTSWISKAWMSVPMCSAPWMSWRTSSICPPVIR